MRTGDALTRASPEKRKDWARTDLLVENRSFPCEAQEDAQAPQEEAAPAAGSELRLLL